MEERIGSVYIQRFEGILQNKFFKATHMTVPFDFEVAATLWNLVSMLMNVKKIFLQDSLKLLYGGIYWCRLVVCVQGEGQKTCHGEM